ncbi:hypothetical protein J3F82_006276, partial [Coemansia sp. RSA 637]
RRDTGSSYGQQNSRACADFPVLRRQVDLQISSAEARRRAQRLSQEGDHCDGYSAGTGCQAFLPVQLGI